MPHRFCFSRSNSSLLELIVLSLLCLGTESCQPRTVPDSELGTPVSLQPEMVTLPNGLQMSKYEITQAQWNQVMSANSCYFTGNNLPVEFITFTEAQEFCTKLTTLQKGTTRLQYRLPTRAEWLYACQGGTKTPFYTGFCTVNQYDTDALDPSLDKAAWYSANSDGHPHRVGTKVPNAFGLYDMHGNVAEWVSKDTDDGEGGYWVCGGSWQDPPFDAVATNVLKIRSRDARTRATPHIGFRVVATK